MSKALKKVKPQCSWCGCLILAFLSSARLLSIRMQGNLCPMVCATVQGSAVESCEMLRARAVRHDAVAMEEQATIGHWLSARSVDKRSSLNEDGRAFMRGRRQRATRHA